MISNLQMITIYVRDMQRAIEFYTGKLGFVKLAEYNDGTDNYLTWSYLNLPAKMILRRKLHYRSWPRKTIRALALPSVAAGWSSRPRPQKKLSPRIMN